MHATPRTRRLPRLPRLPTVAVLSALALGGCQSTVSFRTSERWVTIDSEPQGARVYQVAPLSNQRILLGTTPFESQPVTVLTQAKFESMAMSRAGHLMATVGKLEVSIEKSGFKPFHGYLGTSDGEIMRHMVRLEADAETAGKNDSGAKGGARAAEQDSTDSTAGTGESNEKS